MRLWGIWIPALFLPVRSVLCAGLRSSTLSWEFVLHRAARIFRVAMRKGYSPLSPLSLLVRTLCHYLHDLLLTSLHLHLCGAAGYALPSPPVSLLPVQAFLWSFCPWVIFIPVNQAHHKAHIVNGHRTACEAPTTWIFRRSADVPDKASAANHRLAGVNRSYRHWLRNQRFTSSTPA